jgi:hypothetical protein
MLGSALGPMSFLQLSSGLLCAGYQVVACAHLVQGPVGEPVCTPITGSSAERHFGRTTVLGSQSSIILDAQTSHLHIMNAPAYCCCCCCARRRVMRLFQCTAPVLVAHTASLNMACYTDICCCCCRCRVPWTSGGLTHCWQKMCRWGAQCAVQLLLCWDPQHRMFSTCRWEQLQAL